MIAWISSKWMTLRGEKAKSKWTTIRINIYKESFQRQPRNNFWLLWLLRPWQKLPPIFGYWGNNNNNNNNNNNRSRDHKNSQKSLPLRRAMWPKRTLWMAERKEGSSIYCNNINPEGKYSTEVLGSNGSVGDSHFVHYSRKSVTLDFFDAKFQFGDCQNVRYSRKSVISESVTSENLCITLHSVHINLLYSLWAIHKEFCFLISASSILDCNNNIIRYQSRRPWLRCLPFLSRRLQLRLPRYFQDPIPTR